MTLRAELSEPSAGVSERARLLLVDDNPAKLLALTTILSELDLEIVTAHSARSALKHLLQQEFAVIILDVSMPEMDGFELASLIRQRPRFSTTPIIFITAISTSDAERAKGYRLKAVDYLFMPIIPDVLRGKVSALADLHLKSRQVEMQARELEEQVARIELLNQQLELSNRELEAFSYSVSHDLRAPLRTVMGFCELLREECKDSLGDKGQKYLGFIHSGLVRSESLVEGFLNLSRVTQAAMRWRPVDLAMLSRNLLDDLEDPTFPSVQFLIPRQLMVQGDPELLSLAMQNLLGNAIKFSSKVADPVVELGTLTGDDGEIIYFVRDNGAGFPQDYSDRLFTPFQRLHTQEEFPGTGVGLATVMRVFARHGGRVWATGEVDAGATFYFTLGKKQPGPKF